MIDIPALSQEALDAISASNTLDTLEQLRIHYLGKKGIITQHMKQMGGLSIDEKRELGPKLNALKQSITDTIDSKKLSMEEAELDARLSSEKIDITLPTRPEQTSGKVHPITQVIEEVTAIFADMGFTVAHGPEIEDDFHNFTALNIPPEHPARQMHDTFYIQQPANDTPRVLRTHTSPVQIRTMQQGTPPFRIIAPGSTYRCDYDMTHTPMFHQVEGLVIDKNIHMGHLKGCLIEFVKAFFEIDEVPVRFRTSFFPFTEPSAEVDIGCSRKDGQLTIGTGDDWLEILGCGMVHPNVLRNCNLDPNEWQGFAFGMGIERLAMLKYGMTDLRMFFENDIRWLDHYGFAALDIPNLVGGLSR